MWTYSYCLYTQILFILKCVYNIIFTFSISLSYLFECLLKRNSAGLSHLHILEWLVVWLYSHHYKNICVKYLSIRVNTSVLGNTFWHSAPLLTPTKRVDKVWLSWHLFLTSEEHTNPVKETCLRNTADGLGIARVKNHPGPSDFEYQQHQSPLFPFKTEAWSGKIA